MRVANDSNPFKSVEKSQPSHQNVEPNYKNEKRNFDARDCLLFSFLV